MEGVMVRTWSKQQRARRRSTAIAIWMVLVVATGCTRRSDSNGTIQVADTAFTPRVEAAAYPTPGPRVLFDEAHNNFHTTTGRYKPFVDLLTLDGYHFTANRRPFARDALRDYQVLVIVNASGGTTEDDPDSVLALPAFRTTEVDAVHDWVTDGGALLLIADHAPSGAAAMNLAAAFEVEMRNSWTFDSTYGEPGYGPYNLAFSRTNGLLGDHPITRGRNLGERVNKVVSFTGQSLQGPQLSSPLLLLSDSAQDEDVTETIRVSAAGRVQGLAMFVGQGRVVVLGEAAMLTAQQRVRDGEIRRYGISYDGSDNQQFALNVMHWLSGILEN